MKSDLELEYMSAVAKRTRASTDRFLVAKIYGESGVRNRKRIPDLEVLSDDDDDEESYGVQNGKKEKGVKRKGDTWVDRFPDLTVVDSDEDEEEMEVARNNKGKEKMVTDEKNLAGVPVGSEEESESVRDNDEFNVRCKSRKDVGDDSDGSRTELGSTSKPAADVDENLSVSISGNRAGYENGKEGIGKEGLVSSEEELLTEVISSDTEEDDDDRDEDYVACMTDVSGSSEYASESDSGYAEESAKGNRRREESNVVGYNDNASPSCSDDVIILDESFDFSENRSYAEPGAEELVGGTKEKENVVLYSTTNKDKLDKKNLFTGKGYSSKSAPADKELKAKKTKVKEFKWIAYEENSESTRQVQGSAKHKPEVEVTSPWDDGTVFPDNTSGIKASKTMMDHGDDRKQQQEVLQQKCRNEKSKKRTRSWEKINVFDVLLDTLTSKNGSIHEDAVTDADVIQPEEHDEGELAAPKCYPMLKFTYGVETPVQVEKPEFEQELDKLWDEYEFELRTSEIGSHTHGKVTTNKDTSSEIEKIHSIFCNRGEHKFTLDDEVGIKCKICSFVQLEIKYVMPDWTNFSSRRFDRKSSSDDKDLEMFDCMEFHDSKVGESRSCSDGTVWDLIPEVRDKLYPHQQDGFEFIWRNLMGTISLDELQSSTDHGMGGCIISHAPGTGKTRLTLEFLHSYLELFPGSYPLIIAPAGMLLTWEAEFKKWDVGIPFHNLNSTVLSGKEYEVALNLLNTTKQSCDTHLVRLIKLLSWTKKKSILGLSYSLFEKLAGRRFDAGKGSPSSNKKTRDELSKKFGNIILEKAGLLVLDEGHTPRNPRSRIYKALTNIQTKKRVILSGTPFQNNLAELFTILSFVRPDFALTISPDLRKFCQRKIRMVDMSAGRSGTEPDMDMYDRLAISQLRVKIDPFVHVHKGSVLQRSLPGLKDCVMVLNPPQYQKKLVEMIESSSYTNFEFEHKLSLVSIHPSLLQNEKNESFIDNRDLEARRLDPSEGVKTKFLFEMIRLSEANNEKVLVFSQYLDPLALIMDQICSLMDWHEGKEVIQLVGKLDSEKRQSIINVFNDPDSSAKVLLASTKACSEGINLVGASRVVLLDVVWNPSVERQAISRAFRLGQKKIVYSYNLIVGRMEWEKYRAQTNKEHVSNLVFCSSDEPEKHNRVLSDDRILDELINHSSMEGIFDQIIYHPKDFLFS